MNASWRMSENIQGLLSAGSNGDLVAGSKMKGPTHSESSRTWKTTMCPEMKPRNAQNAALKLDEAVHFTEATSRAGEQRGPGHKNTHIILHHLQFTIRNEEELNKLLGGVTVAQDGVLPNIQAVLLPKKTGHPSKVYN
ncbi:probable histone H2A.5 [Carcharodon carcharias]|uniref:probable histone H2A.5 n=1 Tax=Carcharodon carcharias TaxID=13397 RepID=UPI001B7F4473|nr:probable histone H2A.5 [Carcharodon carcharias]